MDGTTSCPLCNKFRRLLVEIGDREASCPVPPIAPTNVAILLAAQAVMEELKETREAIAKSSMVT